MTTTPALDGHALWALVDRAQNGDTDAYGQLYTATHTAVFRYVRRRVTGHQLAEDLTADVFLRGLVRLAKLRRVGASPLAWLITIAHNRVVDHYKSAHARMSVPIAVIGEYADGQEGDDTVADVADVVVCHDTELTLWAAVQRLTVEQAECLRLRFGVELSVSDTAADMGRQVGAVKTAQYRAVRALRRDPAVAALA